MTPSPVRDMHVIMRGKSQNIALPKGSHRVSVTIQCHPNILEWARLLPITKSLSMVAEAAINDEILSRLRVLKKECVQLRDKELASRDGWESAFPPPPQKKLDLKRMRREDPAAYKFAKTLAVEAARKLLQERRGEATRIERHIRDLGLFEVYSEIEV